MRSAKMEAPSIPIAITAMTSYDDGRKVRVTLAETGRELCLSCDLVSPAPGHVLLTPKYYKKLFPGRKEDG